MDRFTLCQTKIAMANPHLSWQMPSKWWIFHGYVSLPERNFTPFILLAYRSQERMDRFFLTELILQVEVINQILITAE